MPVASNLPMATSVSPSICMEIERSLHTCRIDCRKAAGIGSVWKATRVGIRGAKSTTTQSTPSILVPDRTPTKSSDSGDMRLPCVATPTLLRLTRTVDHGLAEHTRIVETASEVLQDFFCLSPESWHLGCIDGESLRHLLKHRARILMYAIDEEFI